MEILTLLGLGFAYISSPSMMIDLPKKDRLRWIGFVCVCILIMVGRYQENLNNSNLLIFFETFCTDDLMPTQVPEFSNSEAVN